MSGELFSSKPYESFELKEPVVEVPTTVEVAPQPQLDLAEWLGPIALFAVRPNGDFDLEAREAA